MKKSEVKQNRKRRRILIAFIMVLFTGIILTASTYAWFTANQKVTVEQIGGNLEVDWDEKTNTVFMKGPSHTVFESEIDVSEIIK